MNLQEFQKTYDLEIGDYNGPSGCSPRMVRKAELGDYVYAAKFPDFDPHDAWRIGFVVKITETRHGFGYVIGEEDGTWSDLREYKYVKHITAEEGRDFLSANSK